MGHWLFLYHYQFHKIVHVSSSSSRLHCRPSERSGAPSQTTSECWMSSVSNIPSPITCSTTRSGLLQQCVSDPQEVRRDENHHKSQAFESVLGRQTLLHGHIEDGDGGDRTGLLGHLPQSDRRLLPHPCTSRSSTISPTGSSDRGTLSVHMCVLQTSSKSVHQSGSGGGSLVQASRLPHLPLPRCLGASLYKQETLDQTKRSTAAKLSLGWKVLWEKSSLILTQDFQFLGAQIDTHCMQTFPSEEHQNNLIEAASEIQALPSCTIRQVLRLLGLMASCIDLVSNARLFMWPLQMYLLCFWEKSGKDLERIIPIREPCQSHLQCCMNKDNLDRGRSLVKSQTDVMLTTDASNKGWGDHLDEQMAQGLWSPAETHHHINWQEMMAVWRCLQLLLVLIRDKSVLV